MAWGLLTASVGALTATDYYMTLLGAGTKSGASAVNAFAYSSRATVLNTTMVPGDTLYLEGNRYAGMTLSIASSGTATARKRLIGYDGGVVIGGVPYPHPVIEGTSTTENQPGAMVLQSGASYWTLSNLEGRRSGWALHTLGANAGLIIDNVTNFSNLDVSTNFTANGLGFVDADNLLIMNCNVARHKDYGIHLIQGCDNVVIQNCRADGTGTGDTPDSFNSTAGFMFHTDTAGSPMNTNVTLKDCVSRNHRVPSEGQGDGFLVEYNNTGITFTRCLSFDNLQGGFDAKGMAQTFTDCVSVRNGNGFKIWKNATMYNCIATETTGNVLFLPQKYTSGEHVLDAYNCTFHVSPSNVTGGAAVYIENGPANFVRASLYNCLLSRANGNSTYSKNIIAGGYGGVGPSVDLRTGMAADTKQHNSAAVLTNAPKYTSLTSPWKPWDANFSLTTDPAYDSLTYGVTKGYHSTLQDGIDKLALAPTRDSGGNVTLGFQTRLGRTYRVEARNDLALDTWSLIADNVTGTGGAVSLQDPGAMRQEQRFYRLYNLP